MELGMIENLALAFVFITISIFIANKLKFSSIPFLILMGMLVGPHAPEFQGISFSLIHPTESIQLLSRLGILLMLFYLGLEFSAGKLTSAGSSFIKGASIYVILNFLRGLAFGWIFFNTWTEAFIIAGITGISSSAIITKLLLDLRRTANPETELVLGIIVFEDIFLAIYLSVLSGLFLHTSTNIEQIIPAIILIIGFIFLIIALGRHIGKFIEPKLSTRTSESFTVFVFTLLLLMAILADTLHIEQAMGALLLGLILAETEHHTKIIKFITPMRDLFGAVFFFLFGMEINYRLFDQALVLTLAAVLITIIGNILVGLLSSWIAGYRPRRMFNVAFMVIARGEFSIIVASLAASANINPILPAFAALYVLILAFISPFLAAHSRNFYNGYMKLMEKFRKNKQKPADN